MRDGQVIDDVADQPRGTGAGCDAGSVHPREQARPAATVSDFWLLAVRAIRARPLRSVLTASAVALGVAVVLAVQIAIQGLTAQAAEAQMEQAGASSLDVRVDIGAGLAPAQVTTLSDLPGVVQAVPLYEKQVTAGPAGSALEGQTVTLVGLQDSSAALRSVSVAAGRLPLPGSTSEVAIDQGLSTALTGGFGSAHPARSEDPVDHEHRSRPLHSGGLHIGNERRAVVHPRRGLRGRRGDARPVRAWPAHAARGAPFRPGGDRGGRLERGARQVRRLGDHLRPAFQRRRSAAGARAPAGARHRPEPDRRRGRHREQRGARRVRATA